MSIKDVVRKPIEVKEYSRFKNIYLYIGLIGIVFAAAGINPNTLTSWVLVKDAILGILANPVAVASVIMAVVGVFVDNSTPGFKDNK